MKCLSFCVVVLDVFLLLLLSLFLFYFLWWWWCSQQPQQQRNFPTVSHFPQRAALSETPAPSC